MILTINTDLLDKMKQPNFREYLKSLFPPEANDETEEQRLAREAELTEFEQQFNDAYPIAEKLEGGWQCIFNCAKEYVNCRRIYPNYPEALLCDQNAVNCFTNCFLS